MPRCGVPVTERSVRWRNELRAAGFITFVAPQPGADGAARRPYLAGLIGGIAGWSKGFSCLKRDVAGLIWSISY
jgi:hypothetical protein